MEKLLSELNIEPFKEEAFAAGHNACPGCGSTTALRMVVNAIGQNAVYFVPASCGSLYFGPNDTATANVPAVHTVFAAAFAEAEGMSYGLKQRGRKERVIVWAGDGACYDIGFSGLSGVAARDADILVFCNDNEGYQNTGGHESSATPQAAIDGGDPTRLVGSNRRKDLAELIAAHGVPYVATVSAAFPDDLRYKVQKARDIRGFRFILLQTPCVTWGYDSRISVKLARLAVETGHHPLYEVEGGVHYRITYEPEFVAFEEYAKLQKRFRNSDLRIVKREIQDKWDYLRFLASRFKQAAPEETVRESVVLAGA